MISTFSVLILVLASALFVLSWLFVRETRRRCVEVHRLQETLSATVTDVQVIAMTVLDEQQGVVLLTQIHERLQQTSGTWPLIKGSKPTQWH